MIVTAYVLFEQQNLMYEVAQIEHAEIRNIQHIQYYGVLCCLLQLLSINGSDCTKMPLAKVSCYRFTYCSINIFVTHWWGIFAGMEQKRNRNCGCGFP